MRERRDPYAALLLRGICPADPGRARYVPKGGQALSRTELELFNAIVLDFFLEMAAR
ncbi:hypothetical protein [Enterovirga sp. CN4-39]|uniref:hypothetical protein n=1 Tax=Enterovirga sp. CN4-39 TaxID=3400910 RepID=UPI003C0FFD1B